MLTASGLSKSFGDRTLFRDVDLRLLPGRRQALVGGNGTGKTTLIETLLGLTAPDAGEISRPRDLTVGYLPQELPGAEDGTVLEVVMAGAEAVRGLAAEITRLEHLLAATTGAEHDQALEALGRAQSRFEALGGYALEAEAHRVLAGLGFSVTDAQRPVTELSGGWRMRAALARLLLSKPDVLILDEPTNHLDVDSVGWLEQYLAAWSGALLFVSHDRDFIDAVANRVLELSGETLVEYVGGFAEFVVAREDRIAQAEAAAAGQARKIAQVERFIDRFRYKATKARQVQSRLKTLERLERIEVPDQRQLVARFAFGQPRRSSRVVLEAHDMSVGYDDQTVLTGIDLVIERGRKVALVGPNGAGKTTLVRVMLGELAALSGSVALGQNVDVATFHQDQTTQLDPARTVFDEFRAHTGDRAGRNLRTVLGSFGFPGDAADRRVGDLSGGERTRLALAK
ncbi:MAG: ATP-binding cassette domain-containing protein, partial [Acidimicrobiia bacterium]|nr:ATP-binding cassette domain-containing protein [Acidimicrobiia bacterium]